MLKWKKLECKFLSKYLPSRWLCTIITLLLMTFRQSKMIPDDGLNIFSLPLNLDNSLIRQRKILNDCFHYGHRTTVLLSSLFVQLVNDRRFSLQAEQLRSANSSSQYFEDELSSRLKFYVPASFASWRRDFRKHELISIIFSDDYRETNILKSKHRLSFRF